MTGGYFKLCNINPTEKIVIKLRYEHKKKDEGTSHSREKKQ